MKLVPLGDRVVLKQVEAEEKTKSGIIVKPGDKVIFAQYAGTHFKADGEEYIVSKQEDILAIIED